MRLENLWNKLQEDERPGSYSKESAEKKTKGEILQSAAFSFCPTISRADWTWKGRKNFKRGRWLNNVLCAFSCAGFLLTSLDLLDLVARQMWPNFFLMGFPCYLPKGGPQINRTSSINRVSTFCVRHSSIEADMCIMQTPHWLILNLRLRFIVVWYIGFFQAKFW